MKTSLDDVGRILLPPVVQAQLGVKPGDELALQEQDGQWFLKPIPPSVDPHGDDLDWEEVDYDSVPPKQVGQVAVRIEPRGRLTPMAYDFDDG